MKTSAFLSLGFMLLVSACSSTKNTDKKVLQNSTWELEYLSGPKITFEGLFPEKKPVITFDKAGRNVKGNSGCNGYTAPYTLENKNISFGEPGPSTLMFCGDGEGFFRNAMKKVNKYQVDSEGKLVLLMNEVALMRFKKI